MAMQISKAQAQAALSRFEAMKSRLANVQKQAEKATEKFVATMETTGAAFICGLVQGRTGGGVELAGVPGELIAGGLLSVGSYLGVAGKHSDHLANLGNGCLAAYATTMGRGVGATWAEKAAKGEPEQVEAQGSRRRMVRGAALSPQEMADAAAGAARQGAPVPAV